MLLPTSLRGLLLLRNAQDVSKRISLEVPCRRYNFRLANREKSKNYSNRKNSISLLRNRLRLFSRKGLCNGNVLWLEVRKKEKETVMSLAGLVVTIVVIALGIFDLALVLFGGTGSSISNFLITVGFKDPVVVFMVGFICGHLFGYMQPAKTLSSSDKK